MDLHGVEVVAKVDWLLERVPDHLGCGSVAHALDRSGCVGVGRARAEDLGNGQTILPQDALAASGDILGGHTLERRAKTVPRQVVVAEVDVLLDLVLDLEDRVPERFAGGDTGGVDSCESGADSEKNASEGNHLVGVY